MNQPLPPHSTRIQRRPYDGSPATLPVCSQCQTPGARWTFYGNGLGRVTTCHQCFLLYRETDDQYSELLLLPTDDQATVEAELMAQGQKVHDVNDIDVLIFELEQGLYDDAGLDRLQASLQKRLTLIAQARAMVLNRGDHVRLGDTARPQYLRGVEAIVDRLEGTNIWIHLERTVGSVREGRSFALPASAIQTIPQAPSTEGAA